MKKVFTIIILLATINWGQLPTNLLDNFNRADNNSVGSTPTTPNSLTWNEIETAANTSITIASNVLKLGSTTNGRDFAYVDFNGLSGYPVTLSSATGVVTWAFNFRQTRSDPSGFDGTNYGIGFVLGKTTLDVTTGTGYAVIIGQSGTSDPIRLAKFSGGLHLNSSFSNIISGNDYGAEYISVKVTYNPSGNNWSLFAESNASSFPRTDPRNTNTQIGSTTSDNTYTGSALRCLGCLWNHSTGGSDFAYFDDIYVTDPNGAIPVEIVTFTAKQQGSNVTLNWNTATEVRNHGFEIERVKSEQFSANGWSKLGFVNGNGNSNIPHDYTFTDNTVKESGKYIYRLKQIDTDGSFEYSNQIEVNVEIPKAFKLLQNTPNPFNPTTSIVYQLANTSDVTLKVYDILGNEVLTLVNEKQEAGKYEVKLDASKLSSGTYIYRLSAGSFVQTKKMILLK